MAIKKEKITSILEVPDDDLDSHTRAKKHEILKSVEAVKQTSEYVMGNQAAPDNNIFFEERNNPLSSKGN